MNLLERLDLLDAALGDDRLDLGLVLLDRLLLGHQVRVLGLGLQRQIWRVRVRVNPQRTLRYSVAERSVLCVIVQRSLADFALYCRGVKGYP